MVAYPPDMSRERATTGGVFNAVITDRYDSRDARPLRRKLPDELQNLRFLHGINRFDRYDKQCTCNLCHRGTAVAMVLLKFQALTTERDRRHFQVCVERHCFPRITKGRPSSEAAFRSKA